MKKLRAIGRRAKELIASANVPMNGSKLLEDGDCFQEPEDGMTTRQIALARCNCLLARDFREKVVNHQKSDRAQMVTLIFTAMTPVLLRLPWSSMNLLGAAASAIAAIATGYLAITNSRENYIRYGHTWHTLQTEKYRYLTHATSEYADSDEEKAVRHFARRIEQLVMAEVTNWRAEMQRVEQQNPDGAPRTSRAPEPDGAPRTPGAPEPGGASHTRNS